MGSAQEKCCPEEGYFVADMILTAMKSICEALDIFVISPFRLVVERMQERIEELEYKLQVCWKAALS
ncbi:hypothetical protein [Aliikangiella sp. IMCC44359]|uniref:hypothetical protein n=1 Tax=Aliikangiella sp. IMCC44359 TaxID=3459125 RepID=UPI00403ACCE7